MINSGKADRVEALVAPWLENGGWSVPLEDLYKRRRIVDFNII